jgi:phenylacetate-CoA ligase
VDVEENENGFKQGRHIVTNLWNFDTPFIRYDSQDLLEFSGEKCSCGRNLLPIKRILGRDNDVLETPNGKRIIVHIFTIFFSKMPSVKQFQFIQEDEKTVNGKLIVHETFTNEDFSKVTEHCKQVFDDSMSVNIELVDSIPTTKNGKRRFLINRMK